MTKHIVACVQLNTQNNLQENINKACDLIEIAAGKGAEFITLPENVAFMANSFDELKNNSFNHYNNPVIEAFQKSAKKNSVSVLVGSIAIKFPGEDKLLNRCYLINKDGSINAYYDKIHLYDVEVDGGESHKESERFIAGNKLVISETNFANIGLTICYDLRFPNLFRKLAQSGASVITVPSSFTRFTGEAHWHTLLQARAIETGCFIVAPAQTGNHPNNRKTFGHSLIISPWGKILADAGKDIGVITSEIDLSECDKVRSSIPSLFLDKV